MGRRSSRAATVAPAAVPPGDLVNVTCGEVTGEVLGPLIKAGGALGDAVGVGQVHAAARRAARPRTPPSPPRLCGTLGPRELDRCRRCRRAAEVPRASTDQGAKSMPIKLENVAIAVRDLDETITFFTDLGLTVLGRDEVSGEWADTCVGLDGNHAKIAMLQTPDGAGRLELFEYLHPAAIETDPTLPHEIGMHRVAFSVDDLDEALAIAARHGCHPLRGVATYGDVYKLTYIRGPSGIIVMLAEELNKS
jgi:glyoxylase I family protein